MRLIGSPKTLTASTEHVLPNDVEAALAVLETSNDLAGGEDAFWRVQKFRNRLGARMALPNIALLVLAILLSRNAQISTLAHAIVVVLLGLTAILICGALILQLRGRRGEITVYRRMNKALRRWRSLARTSVEKDTA